MEGKDRGMEGRKKENSNQVRSEQEKREKERRELRKGRTSVRVRMENRDLD